MSVDWRNKDQHVVSLGSCQGACHANNYVAFTVAVAKNAHCTLQSDVMFVRSK